MLRWKGCLRSGAELLAIAGKASSLYRIAGRRKKPDGSERILLDALFPLKSIQARIQCMLLKRVSFPVYLQGSIKDRGQASNARQHVGSRLVITEDIENFFPTMSAKVVFQIWNRFFNFPPHVADCLTKLTTKDGSLPQGAKTSPLLANIVFWQRERDLVLSLQKRGIVYTRLVDDITCSTKRDLPPAEVTRVIRQVRYLAASLGFRIKRKKETIAHSNERMVATKLVVNAKLSLTTAQRARIRAAVHACVKASLSSQPLSDRVYNRASGQLAYLAQHHPTEGTDLREQLRKARRRELKRRSRAGGGRS